jgi:apolipoprotein N-acyltransferase
LETLSRRPAAWLARYAASLFSGLLLALSFPNILHPDFFLPGVFIAWICLLPLFETTAEEAPWEAFKKGWMAGLCFFLLSTAWINNIKPMGPGALPAWISLSLYLALYPAAFCWGLAWGRRAKMPLEALWIPALWTLLEFLRERLLTGYPWVSLGSSQYLTKIWLPLASITGIYGLHFVVVAINLTLWWAYKRRKEAFTGLCVIAAMALLRLSAPGPAQAGEGTKVAVIQGNIDQDQAWTESYRHELMSVYGRLMRQAVDAGAKVLIWPESAFPGFFNEPGAESEVMRQFAKNNHVDLIFGSTLSDGPGGSYSNAVVFVDDQGNTAAYRKRHLVPFGEYIPFRASIPLLDGLMDRFGMVDFKPGPQAGLSFQSRQGPQGLITMPLVCYESIFGRSAAHSQGMDSDLIAVVTLDTWFGNSAAPRYHALHGILQAVESGKWVARAAATGISCFVSPQGELMDVVPLNTEGWSAQVIPKHGAPTFYWIWGSWFLWLCLGSLTLSLGLSKEGPFLR